MEPRAWRWSASMGAIAWGGAAVALLLASALPPFLTDTGIWQFGGGPELFASLPAAAWIFWLSLFLVRNPDFAEAL